jgi:hypothetical protein
LNKNKIDFDFKKKVKIQLKFIFFILILTGLVKGGLKGWEERADAYRITVACIVQKRILSPREILLRGKTVSLTNHVL